MRTCLFERLVKPHRRSSQLVLENDGRTPRLPKMVRKAIDSRASSRVFLPQIVKLGIEVADRGRPESGRESLFDLRK